MHKCARANTHAHVHRHITVSIAFSTIYTTILTHILYPLHTCTSLTFSLIHTLIFPHSPKRIIYIPLLIVSLSLFSSLITPHRYSFSSIHSPFYPFSLLSSYSLSPSFHDPSSHFLSSAYSSNHLPLVLSNLLSPLPFSHFNFLHFCFPSLTTPRIFCLSFTIFLYVYTLNSPYSS